MKQKIFVEIPMDEADNLDWYIVERGTDLIYLKQVELSDLIPKAETDADLEKLAEEYYKSGANMTGVSNYTKKDFIAGYQASSRNNDAQMCEFAEWLENNHYWKSTDDRFPETFGFWTTKINGDYDPKDKLTTAQLLELFKNRNK